MHSFTRTVLSLVAGIGLAVTAHAASSKGTHGANPLIAPTTSEQERKAVSVPLDFYLQGQATDQGEYFRKAFDRDARIIGYSASSKKFVNLSVDQFAGNFVGKNPEDPKTHHRSYEILEITGTVAIARVSSDLPESRYADYMSLQKIDGDWKIVNKSFFEQLK